MTVTVLFVLISFDISTCSLSFPTTRRTLTMKTMRKVSMIAFLTVRSQLAFELSDRSCYPLVVLLLRENSRRIHDNAASPDPFVIALLYSPPCTVTQSSEQTFRQTFVFAPFCTAVEERKTIVHGCKSVKIRLWFPRGE